MEVQSGKQAYYYDDAISTWNDFNQSRSNQQGQYLRLPIAPVDRPKEATLLFGRAENILTHEDNSHQLNVQRSYQASSDITSHQLLSSVDEVTIDFQQMDRQNQQRNVYNNGQYTACSNIFKHHDTLFSPIPLIEHASVQQFPPVANESANYETEQTKKSDQNGNEEKEQCALFNNTSITTYSWMKKEANSKGTNKQKRTRQSYTRQQLLECEKQFYTTPYITKEILQDLAHRTNLSRQQVKVWFQNRRMKQKKEKKNKYCHTQEVQSSSLDINYRQPAQDLSSSNSESSISNVQSSLQSQQSGHAQMHVQPTVPTQISQIMPLQLETINNTQLIVNEHNRWVYMQPKQQCVQCQPQDDIRVQSQPVMHMQSSFIELKQQTMQELEKLSQSQMIRSQQTITHVRHHKR